MKGNVEGSKLRAPSLPNVPTVAKTFPGFNAATWFAPVAPAGMPREAIMRINAEAKKIVAMADIQQSFDKLGMIPDQEPDRVFLFG